MMTSTTSDSSIVYVIDDDQSVRDSLEDLLASVGLQAMVFSSAAEFLRAKRPDAPACIVLDIRMPGMSGLDFQDEMIRMGLKIPVIFITGHGDIQMSVRAMKAGAVEFLTKPFRDQDLLDAIQHSIVIDRENQAASRAMNELQARYQSLNTGEQEVMELVVQGLLNKQVAARLGISEVTVKVRRGNVTRKMDAQSLADLVRFAEKLRTAESAS